MRQNQVKPLPIGEFDSLSKMLDLAVRHYGELPALSWSAGPDTEIHRVTYAELGAQVRRVAIGLLGLGLKRGDRVALLGENRAAWAISYLAILRAGGTVIPLDSLLKPNEIAGILSIGTPRFVMVSKRYLTDLASVIPGDKIEAFICMDAVDRTGVFDWSALGKDRPLTDLDQVPYPVAKDLATILFTSGTTGSAKGVMLSHGNIVADLMGINAMDIIHHGDRMLSMIPLHHTYECTAGFLLPISAGACVHYARSLKPNEIVEDMRISNATLALGVPLLFEKMLQGILKAISKKQIGTRLLFHLFWAITRGIAHTTGKNAGVPLFRSLREKAGLGQLRLLVSGGAALPVQVENGFHTLGINMVQGYGLTESSPVLTLNPVDRPRPGSIGRPIPGAEIKIDRPDATGVGEIVARGGMVMLGYYKNDTATREVLRDDWLHTGDLGYRDRDGYIHISGRSKNLIVTPAGKNVYPEEIEEVLLKSPYLAECVVLGKKSQNGHGEEVSAIVVPNLELLEEEALGQGTTLTWEDVERKVRQEVKERCRNLADFKRVKEVTVQREELVKTSSRKVRRYLYRPNG